MAYGKLKAIDHMIACNVVITLSHLDTQIYHYLTTHHCLATALKIGNLTLVHASRCMLTPLSTMQTLRPDVRHTIQERHICLQVMTDMSKHSVKSSSTSVKLSLDGLDWKEIQ